MNWVDAAIVLAFLFFIVTAFNNGFIRELIALASAIVGVVVAGLLYDDLADSLLSAIDNDTTQSVVAFLLIFAGITIAGQLLALLVHPAVVILQLGIADQLLGAGFGAAKGFVIIVGLLVLGVTYPRYETDQRINDSEFAGILLDAASPVLAMLPEQFDAAVEQFTGSGTPIIDKRE